MEFEATIVGTVVGIVILGLLLSWAMPPRALPVYRHVLAELRRVRGDVFISRLVLRELLLANSELAGAEAAPPQEVSPADPQSVNEEPGQSRGREKNPHSDTAIKPVTRAAKRRNKQLRQLRSLGGATRPPPGTIDLAGLHLAKFRSPKVGGSPSGDLSLPASRDPKASPEAKMGPEEKPAAEVMLGATPQAPNGATVLVRAPLKPELPPPKPKALDWKQQIAGIDDVWLPHAREAMKAGAPIDFVASR